MNERGMIMKFLSLTVLFFAFSAAYATEAGVLESWQKTMKFGISSQRTAVIKAIEDAKATDAYNLIQDALLNDVNPEIRGTAAYSLINLKIADDTLWNKALSSEKDPEVLRKVVFGINELKVKSAGPRLYSILTNSLDDPKRSALIATTIRAIGSIDYKPASDKVLFILTNIEMAPEVRGAAAIAVGELGSGKYIGILQGMLENIGEAGDVRMYSAYAIGKSGDAKALEILTPYIESEKEDLNIRLWGIAGLAYVNSPKVPEMLIRFSKVDNIRIRLEAVKSLGKLKSAEATEILKYKAIYDPDLGVKREAKTALQGLGVDVEKLVQEATKPKDKPPVTPAPVAQTNAKPVDKTPPAPETKNTNVQSSSSVSSAGNTAPVTTQTNAPQKTKTAPAPEVKKKPK